MSSEKLDPQPRQASLFERALTVVAYPFSLAAGWYVGDASVKRSIYSNFAKRKLFEDLQIPETDAIKKVLANAKVDKTIHVANEVNVIHEDYRLAVKARMEEWGMKGVKDYWKGLHHNQKIEAAGLAITVSGVALGALLTIADHIDRVKSSIQPEDEHAPKSIQR